MAERLIRESDVIKFIDEWLDNYPLPRHIEKGLQSHEELLAYIADAPTIEAKPVVHAHWNDDGRCTNCGGHAPFFAWTDEWFGTKFCPHCGAQMDEVASDNNVGSKTEGIKIPVISMEDVPKIMEEFENEHK